ncbi:hypothetical protein HRG_001955 [Hirsutella rhossiliensis]|uniref:Protein CAP22 n=1 Tax=Hirsutella rhossiliensis TaxID=111463 RepID=A0A9P8SMW0_9HYPO|nr:uncharacterized protein HRG_01955 [Hirsutella rhossiliensis]KAH0966546.1 hypothetical protein HRG_01955 [Hirsutella rhossiliensis]
MYTGQKIALAIAPFLLAAQALDVPNACRAMCAPIDDLERRCDARDGPNEQTDETNCICADTAVVRTIFPLCMDCIRQNPATNRGNNDDADAEDIRDAQTFLSRCGAVSTARYSPAATSVIQSISASGTSQATRTGGPQATGSTGSGSSGGATASASGSRPTASSQRSGASGVQLFGGVSAAGALYVAGAFVAGGLLMLC